MLRSIDANKLQACIFNRWSPEIGDPSVMGWLTVVIYAVAGILCMVAARRSREPRFWILIGLLMLALAINKQLDLQSALTALGRCISKMQGWYDQRRAFQRDFIVGLIMAAVAFLILLTWVMRHSFGRVFLALVGTAFVLGFVAVRAAGFHHMDALIGSYIGPARINWVLELAGISLIMLNALWRVVRDRGSGGTPVTSRV